MTTSTHIFLAVYFLRGVKQQTVTAEAESKEKHGVWDPMPGVTITSLYVHSRVDANTFTMGNPMPESTLTLCQSQLYPPVRDFGLASGSPASSQEVSEKRGQTRPAEKCCIGKKDF
jgi:hypothetical protein